MELPRISFLSSELLTQISSRGFPSFSGGRSNRPRGAVRPGYLEFYLLPPPVTPQHLILIFYPPLPQNLSPFSRTRPLSPQSFHHTSHGDLRSQPCKSESLRWKRLPKGCLTKFPGDSLDSTRVPLSKGLQILVLPDLSTP